MEYVVHILILIAIYTTLATSLDLLVGETGLLSAAQAAFFGVGAYTSALLSTRYGLSFLSGVAAGMALAIALSTLVALISLRVQEDYFVIATFALQIIAFSIFNNWIDVTQGPSGVANIPPPEILGWNVQASGDFLVLAAGVAAIAYCLVSRITASPFGRVLRAIREDDVFTQAQGKNTLRFKLEVSGISAGLAAAAGSVYAYYLTFIDPTTFTITQSILLISMVILGGAGSRMGPLVGAAFLVVLPEALRFVGISSASAANLQAILYGAALVGLMMVRPRGLLGRYSFGQ